MKRKHPLSMLLTCNLVAGMVLVGSFAHAQGPRTPVEAFNRLQGKTHPTHLQAKPLLHTHGTTPLLKTPGTKELVRGQSKTVVRPTTKVVSKHHAKLDTSKLFGKTVTPTHQVKPTAKPAARPVSWLGRIFSGFSSLFRR